MGSRSPKEQKMFQKFKEEVRIVTLKGNNSVRKAIKWKGKIFMTGSLVEVFKTIKNDIANE